VSVPDVYVALWRHKLLIVVLTAGIVAGAWVLTKREQPVYSSSSLVRIQQRISDPTQAFGALETGGRLAQTYAIITGTPQISRKIYSQLHGTLPLGEIEGSLSATQVQDLELLTLTARSWNPKYAAEIANAAPQALKSFIHQTGTLRDEVITVQDAGVPTAPTSPSLRTNIILALLVGLIFNAAIALVLEILADRAHSPEEFERLAGKPVLATVPTVAFSSQRPFARESAAAPTEERVP
jgi:protein tyrosine kinase modulator